MYIKISAPYLVVILLSTVFNVACAQPDTSSLIAAKRQATTTFLDSKQPKRARLQAAKNLGYPDDKTFTELARIGTDASEDAEIRLLALQLHKYDDNYFDAVLSIISDSTGNENLATGLIKDISQRTTFRLPAEYNQRLQTALRSRLDDDRISTKVQAYRTLVASHDVVAVDKLVEGLRNENPPIPLPVAIELLDVDGSQKHIETLRPYLGHSDTAVQAQAARALAVDPTSQADIAGLASSGETDLQVRVNALRALSREDEGFMEYAIKLMDNRDEHPDIRYAAMKNAMGRLNYQGEPAATQINFAISVEQLSQERGIITSDQKDVGAEAKKLLPHLSRTFPAVKKYFQRRN